MTRTILCAIIVLLVSLKCYPQKTVEELASTSPKKFFKDVFYDTSLGNDLVKLLNKKRIRFGDLPNLKKVGLLSVYIRDDAFRRGRKGGIIYDQGYKENVLAAGILDASYNSIAEILGKLGMELLTPAEYLTDEDKEGLYRNFEFNYTSIPEAKKFGDFFTRNEGVYATPNNYEMIYAAYQGGNPEIIINSVGSLCSQFNLDAFLTIEIQTRTTSKSVILESITVVMHGRHPVLADEGMLLATGKYAPSSMVPFAEIEEDQINRSRFDGFDTILTRLVSGLAEIVLGEIESIE